MIHKHNFVFHHLRSIHQEATDRVGGLTNVLMQFFHNRINQIDSVKSFDTSRLSGNLFVIVSDGKSLLKVN